MEIKIIKKKRMKNIIIKVDTLGNVVVSAPYRTSKKYIQEVIENKKDWIEQKVKEALHNKKEVSTLSSGEEFVYLGKKYTIDVWESPLEFCRIMDDKFIISTTQDEFTHKQKLVNIWICENFYTYMEKLTNYFASLMGYSPKVIKFRDMKTRWGSCNSTTKSITFNQKLYTKPPHILEYVVVHEIAHIPYPHHQKEFWDFVEKFLPDWKLRRMELKKGV